MFTPQRQWAGPSRTPRSEARTPNLTGNNKLVALIDDAPPPPPPTGLLSDNGNIGSTENMEDWRRFREVGLLDEAALERRDREALQERTQRLEREVRWRKIFILFGFCNLSVFQFCPSYSGICLSL